MMIEKDWLFSSDEYICDLRTVGVLVKNNRVLVQRDKNGSEYALPGGHIKIGERRNRSGHQSKTLVVERGMLFGMERQVGT